MLRLFAQGLRRGGKHDCEFSTRVSTYGSHIHGGTKDDRATSLDCALPPVVTPLGGSRTV